MREPSKTPDRPPFEPKHAEAGADAQTDHRLVTRCVAGEVSAWEELYAQCHDALCVSVQVMLGRNSDRNVVDEVAARVWYRLVDNDGELLARYSPNRGARLITFMRALAKDEVCRHFRSESRRQRREAIAVQERPRYADSDLGILGSDLNLFLGTLTPKECAFCREVLLGEPQSAGGGSRTKSNVWQLTHRVYDKLASFLGR